MKNRERMGKAGYIAVLLMGTLVCVLKPYVPPLPDSMQKHKSEYISSLTGMYPKSFSVVQRIVLQIRDRHYDFLGHLAMRRAAVFRATALGDMGGKLFDLYAEEGKAELLENPIGLPAKPIICGVAKDIWHVFDIKIGSKSYLSRTENDTLSLVDPVNSDLFNEYFFQPEGRMMIFSRTVSGGKLVREVKYGTYTKLKGFDQPLPKRIFLDNHRWRYKLEIEILSISPSIKEIKNF